jgi:hypothetical protein
MIFLIKHMSLEGPQPPEPKSGREPSPFPVSAEAVKEVLLDIERDPDGMVQTEGARLSIDSGALSEGLIELSDRLRGGPSAKERFVDGALWTYAALRVTCQKAGIIPPQVTQDGFSAYRMSVLERMVTANVTDPIVDAEEEMRTMEQRDPAFFALVREIGRYMTEKGHFHFGAVTTHGAIQAAHAVEELNKEIQ